MNENREVAIRISGVKKMYKLGQIDRGTLQEDLQSWWARVRGKEDPNSKIGQEERLVGQTFMALNGIDLTIYRGEAIGIIGANGAGKSTLLKLLSRVTAPTEGEIDLYGRVSSMLEVKTGFSGEMTGRENVYVRGAILGMTKAEIDSKMEQIIDFSELRDFIDTPFKRYSSGMKVKLGFSVSAHLDSEIIIMDEVLAVGDMAFQTKCLGKMREAAKQEGRTVLYVSHNMNTIRTLCDRCIVLDQGRIVYDGDVEEAIDLYLNSNSSEETPFQNLENRDRPSYTNKKAFMHSFEILDKEDCIFRRGNPLAFRIRWTAKENLDDVYFRMIIRSSNDIPIGLVQSEQLGNYIKGKKNENSLSFDTSLLADGRYFLSIALFQKDDVGNSIILDHVTRACCFEIIGKTDEEQKLTWENRWWGCIKFPALKSLS